MEVKIIVNNKGRCSRCCYSNKIEVQQNYYPLFEEDKPYHLGLIIKKWLYCLKYRRLCKGIACHCKAPQEGFHDSPKEKN